MVHFFTRSELLKLREVSKEMLRQKRKKGEKRTSIYAQVNMQSLLPVARCTYLPGA
jgi:hypothetical protein